MRDRSFYFRGPGGRHNLKAHNLAIFSQIAEGISEETWLYHLYRGDYSKMVSRQCQKYPTSQIRWSASSGEEIFDLKKPDTWYGVSLSPVIRCLNSRRAESKLS